MPCGTTPNGIQENDNIDINASFISYTLKDRLLVWLSGCNYQFDCNFSVADNFVNNLASSGLLLFDSTCIGTATDSAPNSIPYNWQKFGNLITANNNFVFKSGMFPLGILVVPNCNKPAVGTAWVASINASVSGSGFYTKNLKGGDEGFCEYGAISAAVNLDLLRDLLDLNTEDWLNIQGFNK